MSGGGAFAVQAAAQSIGAWADYFAGKRASRRAQAQLREQWALKSRDFVEKGRQVNVAAQSEMGASAVRAMNTRGKMLSALAEGPGYGNTASMLLGDVEFQASQEAATINVNRQLTLDQLLRDIESEASNTRSAFIEIANNTPTIGRTTLQSAGAGAQSYMNYKLYNAQIR